MPAPAPEPVVPAPGSPFAEAFHDFAAMCRTYGRAAVPRAAIADFVDLWCHERGEPFARALADLVPGWLRLRNATVCDTDQPQNRAARGNR